MSFIGRFRARRNTRRRQVLGALIPVDPAHWTAGEILRAIKAWDAIHGEAPRYSDWHRSAAPGWPTARQVESRFGSWSKGLELAGMRPRPAHRPRKDAPRPSVHTFSLLHPLQADYLNP